MRTEEGNLPILFAVPNGDSALALVYDKTLSDPVTDWGHCMEQFRQCFYKTSGRIGACVGAIPRCSPSEATKGGKGCCPGQCVADFERAVAAGAEDNVAVNTTVVQGTCVSGFVEFTGVVQ